MAQEAAERGGEVVGDQKAQMGIVGGDEIGPHDKDHQRHDEGGDAHGEIAGPFGSVGEEVGQGGLKPLGQAVQGAVDGLLHLLGQVGQQGVEEAAGGLDGGLDPRPDILPVGHQRADLGKYAVAEGGQNAPHAAEDQQNEQQGEDAPAQAQGLLKGAHQGVEQPGQPQG